MDTCKVAYVVLLWWATVTMCWCSEEGAIRVARCRSVCIDKFCSLPAHHYAVTLAPSSGECWETCMRLFEGQGQAYMCDDPETFCQTEGCKLACRVYHEPVNMRSKSSRFPHSPVVTVLSDEWLKLLWTEPKSSNEAAITYLLSWMPDDAKTDDWVPFDMTIGTEGEFHRGERGSLPARLRVSAVDASGLVASAEVSREKFIHVAFPDDKPLTTPTTTSTQRPEGTLNTSKNADITPTSEISAVHLLSAFETMLRIAVKSSDLTVPADTTQLHKASSTLQYLLFPAAITVVCVLLLLLIVTASTCHLKRMLSQSRTAAIDKWYAKRRVEKEREREEADGAEIAYGIDLQEHMANISALLDEDDIALEKLMSDPRGYYTLTIDSESPLLQMSGEQQNTTTAYLSLDQPTEDSNVLFIPRYA